MRRIQYCSLSLLVLSFAAIAQAADDALTLEPRESWTNVFADKDVEFLFVVKSAKEWKGRAEWSLAAENERTLANGDADVAVAKDKPGEVVVKLKTPEVKPGVILKARLRVRLFVGGNAKPVATHDRPLWIFPNDPFVDRKDWLKGLKITLYDPEKTTAEALRKLEVPFDETNNVASLSELKEGMLLIGEGVNFKECPDLPEALLRTAANGLPVLCLAPTGGAIPVPGAGVKGPQPRAVTWRRREHIRTLDARLDANSWAPDGKVIVSTMVLKADDGAVVAELGSGANDWPWLETEYPTKTGRLIVCGFGMFGKPWSAGPTPRYLFARLLEVMNPKTEDPREKETKQ